MEAQIVKKGVLNAFSGIITDLSVKEIENLQDCLSIQMHKLTDDGKRIKLKDLKKDLNDMLKNAFGNNKNFKIK